MEFELRTRSPTRAEQYPQSAYSLTTWYSVVGHTSSLYSYRRYKHQKVGGPDDYSAPRIMEYYLYYRHPMSMLEFYVDHGGGLRSQVSRSIDKTRKLDHRTSIFIIQTTSHRRTLLNCFMARMA
jgi:hypothetical protein